jgi:hypothetical protein
MLFKREVSELQYIEHSIMKRGGSKSILYIEVLNMIIYHLLCVCVFLAFFFLSVNLF